MNQNRSTDPLLAVSSGVIAGSLEVPIIMPLEFAKTQMQLQAKTKGAQIQSMGFARQLQLTAAESGISSIYQGLAPAMLSRTNAIGIRFGINTVLKEKLKDGNGNMTPATNFLAGVGAGVGEAVIAVTPFETVKTKCIELNHSFVQGLKHIVREEGITGVYKGATACAIRQGFQQGLGFMYFNEYKAIITNHGERQLTTTESLLGGMSSGCFCVLGNNWIDVVKTRMQSTQAAQYSGTFDCFRQILAKEGCGAFYAGIAPRLVRTSVGQGIIFMTFESIQQLLQSQISFFQ